MTYAGRADIGEGGHGREGASGPGFSSKEPALDYAKVTTEFRRLALEAGAAIMSIRDAGGFAVRSKDDSTPVTEADEKADAVIFDGLRCAFPDLPLVTEERVASHDRMASTFLIVDPLDGTKEFIGGSDDFTVNIALVEDGVPTRGVVYAPAKRRLFQTDAEGRSVEESGPFGVDAGGARVLAPPTPDNGALVVATSKSHHDGATDEYIARYSVRETARAGSSLKFCLIATGEAHLYPRLGRTMEWDTAAGDAVLRGAGGSVVRFDVHAPLGYGKEGFVNPYFIAHAPGVDLKPAP